MCAPFVDVKAPTGFRQATPAACVVVSGRARDTPERHPHTRDARVLGDFSGGDIHTPIFRRTHARGQVNRHTLDRHEEPEARRFAGFRFNIEDRRRHRPSSRATRLIERDRRHTHRALIRTPILFATANAFRQLPRKAARYSTRVRNQPRRQTHHHITRGRGGASVRLARERRRIRLLVEHDRPRHLEGVRARLRHRTTIFGFGLQPIPLHPEGTRHPQR